MWIQKKEPCGDEINFKAKGQPWVLVWDIGEHCFFLFPDLKNSQIKEFDLQILKDKQTKNLITFH